MQQKKTLLYLIALVHCKQHARSEHHKMEENIEEKHFKKAEYITTGGGFY